MEKNDVFALAEIKSSVTFDLVINSLEPNFIDIKRDHGHKGLLVPVAGVTRSFLKSTFPDQTELSADIAVAIIDRNPTWSMLDTVNFYKTILNRQDMEEFRVFGNKITVLKLMEMCSAYEMLKAEAHERIIADKKGRFSEDEYKRRESTDVSVRGQMGKMLERVYIEAEKNPARQEKRTPADEKYFNSLNKNGNDN